MKIILIRHGMTEGNLKRRYIGTTDEDLINTDCLKGDYPKCERVVASPLKRCIQTAEYIYPNVDIEICDKLKECDFGDFENKSYEDLKDNPDYQKWLDSNGELPFPNGETHEDFKNRCKDGFFESLTERDTAFVIHGGSIMAIMQKLFGGNFYDYQASASVISSMSFILFPYDSTPYNPHISYSSNPLIFKYSFSSALSTDTVFANSFHVIV